MTVPNTMVQDRKIPTMPRRRVRGASVVAVALALGVPAVPLMAQDTLAEARMRKMEAEIRALQRKVFPGDDKFFTPEIQQGGTAAPPGQPATSAVSDILRRLDAIEAQVARLTGQVEQNTNRISQLEARAGISGETAAPAAITPPASAAVAPAAAATSAPVTTNPAPVAVAPPAPAATPVAKPTPPAPAPAPKPSPTTASAKRLAAVQAIVKPQTDDAGDDEYSYGFRLWDAKFYPEAQQQLGLFLNKYPKHSRVSFGRNLLGRAYLDDGNPTEAAKWFLQNYQADKRGARAPDSLLYLAVAMKQLKDTKRACIALAEFSETYAAEAAGRLKGDYDAARNGLSCS